MDRSPNMAKSLTMLMIIRQTLTLTFILLVGFELHIVLAKPSAQPVDSNGPISSWYGQQTDQRQYIDRTELFSYPMDMRDISSDDDDDDDAGINGSSNSGNRKSTTPDTHGQPDAGSVKTNANNFSTTIVHDNRGPKYSVIVSGVANDDIIV